MLTEDQKKDVDRLARYVAREQLVSVMNDTKWRRLFDVLKPIQGSLDFRRKDVRGTPDAAEGWSSDIYHMMGGCSDIEWLDIRAMSSLRVGALLASKVVDKTPQLIGVLHEAGVPFSRGTDSVRVWGYVRPGVSPKWEEKEKKPNQAPEPTAPSGRGSS